MSVINSFEWEPVNDFRNLIIPDTSFIDVYRISVSQNQWLLSFVNSLSESETKYCESFIKEKDRVIKKLGKISTRKIISCYGSIPAEQLIIQRNEFGKPECSNMGDVQFNLSDSGDTIVLVVSSSTVGVDIEMHNHLFAYEDVVNDFFSEAEITTMHSAPDPLKAFYNIWVRKESILKAIGTGFGNIHVHEEGWESRVYQAADYSMAITFAFGSYAVRFFSILPSSSES